MNIGYARVSTNVQTLDSQIDKLTQAGCDQIVSEKVSSRKERPELEQLLKWLRPDDTIFCTRMDRLARSLSDLIQIMETISNKGANIKFLDQPVDTTTPAGKLSFTLFAAVAEFERDIIRERTRAGLKAARARGRCGGRPRAISDSQLQAIFAVYDKNQMTIAQMCSMFKVKKQTFYGYLRKRNQSQPTVH